MLLLKFNLPVGTIKDMENICNSMCFLGKISLLLFLSVACMACADLTVYAASPSVATTATVLIGILCFCGLLFYVWFMCWAYPLLNRQGQESVLTLVIYQFVGFWVGVLLFPRLIFGEWFFKFFTWLLAQPNGYQIVIVLLGLLLGSFNGVTFALILWFVNVFYWHLDFLYYWYILPIVVASLCRMYYDWFIMKSER